jgi:6-phosphogluconolactonase
MHKPFFCFITALAALAPLSVLQAAPNEWIAYIGTYTRNKSKGIYAYRFDPKTGNVTDIGLVAETSNPSFLAVHPNQKFLYAVNENRDGKVNSFAIDAKTGHLKLLNQVSTKGDGPCHLTLDHTGKVLIAVNYGGGSTASYQVHDDGTLSEASFIQHTGSGANKNRQGAPHAHSAVMSPDNKLVMVADLGLDKILEYKVDTGTGTLTPNDPPSGSLPPGSGPRHTTFSKDGKFLYAINEILSSVTVFSFDPKGTLTDLQNISTLPAENQAKNASTAEIRLHPNGKWLYGSNRGADTIAMFTVDTKSGKLTAGPRVASGGKTPRGMNIDPTGAYLWVGSQDADLLTIFKIDQKTGALTPAGKTIEVGAPVDVLFVAPK